VIDAMLVEMIPYCATCDVDVTVEELAEDSDTNSPSAVGPDR
jgi:hypothetical protein